MSGRRVDQRMAAPPAFTFCKLFTYRAQVLDRGQGMSFIMMSPPYTPL